MKTEATAAPMGPEEPLNRSRTGASGANGSETAGPVLNAVQQLWNVSAVTVPHPAYTEESLARRNGIVPGAVAAAVFIAFLLGLYAVLWKCMVSPPQRKKRKTRGRLAHRTPI